MIKFNRAYNSKFAIFFAVCSFVASAQSGSEFYKNIRLSPIPKSVGSSAACYIPLDGEWIFEVPGKYQPSPIKVPCEWEMQNFKVEEGEVAVYSKSLDMPQDWRGKSIKIRFDGVSTNATVKVNGHKVAEHEGGFTPFEADITQYLKPEANTLQVEVKALTISDRLSVVSQYAGHTVGGILRKVTLFALPKANISGFSFQTNFDNKFKNAELKLFSQVTNEADKASSDLKIRYTLKDQKGIQLQQQVFALGKIQPGQSLETNNTLSVKAPNHWTPETPYLYDFTTELLDGDKVLQTNSNKVGFREISVKGNLLLVNGVAVKLRGVCRHSVHPLTGRSVSPNIDAQDAKLFKTANCNYIRTSHYPPSEAFLEACDALGLFVESESALCWVNHGATPFWKSHNYKDETYLPYMLRANVDNVLAGRNHASVILWSLGNESMWSPLWEKVNTTVKSLDPSRPTSFHDQCWGGFNNASSKADIANYHYPNIKGPATCDTMRRPVLFGEYAHLSCYNRRELLADPGIRGLYGKALEKMNDEMYEHPANLGGAIWAAIDDVFRMPDGTIVGYGPWGPIDAWRRPKPEYWGMKKAYTPVRVFNADSAKVVNGKLVLHIQNRYDFTNLKELKIICVLDGTKKDILPLNIAPHKKGVLSIPVPSQSKEVYIAFVDKSGNTVNEERVLLHKEGPPSYTDKQNVTLSENAETLIVERSGIKFIISKLFGNIVSATNKEGHVILSKGPAWGVVKKNSDDGGMPGYSGRTYQNDIDPIRDYALLPMYTNKIYAQEVSDGVKVYANVMLQDDVECNYVYHFEDNGNVNVAYTVKYPEKANAISARQYGLFFELPKNFNQIYWKRKGEFSLYPQDDIARTEGKAFLNSNSSVKPAEVIGIEPKGTWKDDAIEQGSNDFIATKQNIYRAFLSNDKNNKFEVLSNGTQSIRSWLQGEHIQVLVADYNGYGSEPFYSEPFHKPETDFKKTLEGRVVFRVEKLRIAPL